MRRRPSPYVAAALFAVSLVLTVLIPFGVVDTRFDAVLGVPAGLSYVAGCLVVAASKGYSPVAALWGVFCGPAGLLVLFLLPYREPPVANE